jgi:hypothetical protein
MFENQLAALQKRQFGRFVAAFLLLVAMWAGGERTSSAFILQQVEGAINHFKNPSTSPPCQPNLLDE